MADPELIMRDDSRFAVGKETSSKKLTVIHAGLCWTFSIIEDRPDAATDDKAESCANFDVECCCVHQTCETIACTGLKARSKFCCFDGRGALPCSDEIPRSIAACCVQCYPMFKVGAELYPKAAQ